MLVTGATGSGKSTTLAAMIDYINTQHAYHIVTIEDPIEYTFRDKRSVLNQREIGFDTMSFARALRAALRQDPDVILVGEMRDFETAQIAMTAAETGHLVLSTLHTVDATETINRIVSMFPTHQQQQARLTLASVLRGVISQRLLPRADGKGMVPALEIMVNTERVREMIEEPTRTREIKDAICRGSASLRHDHVRPEPRVAGQATTRDVRGGGQALDQPVGLRAAVPRRVGYRRADGPGKPPPIPRELAMTSSRSSISRSRLVARRRGARRSGWRRARAHAGA